MSSNSDRIVRMHYIFHGAVQGVGFRYRAVHAASALSVSGWVENLSDGTVEMEAQGRFRDIAKMIAMIRMGTYVDIVDMDVKELPLCPDEHYFHAR